MFWKRISDKPLPEVYAFTLNNKDFDYMLNLVQTPISERLYGSDKEWEPIEIAETDPDYSDKMARYGQEGYT